MTNQDKVKEFHRIYGSYVGVKPTLDIPTDIIQLRLKLIDEENKEVKDAINEGDIVHVAKELADLLYVVYGTAIGFGIDVDAVFEAVHESNMSKLDDNGRPIFREDGKVLKGPHYKEPDVAKVLGLDE